MSHHRKPLRTVTLLRAIVVGSLLLGGLLVLGRPLEMAAASSLVDCGQIVAYTAPDPAGPTPGSLTIGMLPAWTIAADATLSPAIVASLPGLAGSGPSCFAMDLDDSATITSLDFADHGEVVGAVVFDSGFGGYIFANRLLVPTFITDTYPGLAAIFVTSEAAGTNAAVTFTVDTASGQLTAVDARAGFCGAGDLANNGDGLIGAAVIPASVLDAADRKALTGANLRDTCAVVRTRGTINIATGELSLTTTVTITVAADPSVHMTAPPTDLYDVPTTHPEPQSPLGLYVILGALSAVWLSGRVRRSASLDHAGRARRQLERSGANELVIQGRDRRIHEQNTVGGADPRRSKG
jgi:hypothetical protein